MKEIVLKTKIDKACFIASVLFMKSVTINNWKVKELQKKRTDEIDELVEKSKMVLISKNLINL